MRSAEVHDQQHRRDHSSANRRDPHGDPRKIDMVEENRTTRDHRRHPGHPAEEKVERNFPRPHRRLNDRLTIVSRSAAGRTRRGELARNRSTDNIDTATGNNTFLPRLLAQLFKSLFRWRISRHAKNANATSVAMMDAMAVTNAEVHADFR